MSWHELETIYDFIESCKEDAEKYGSDLRKEEKENLAAAILSLTFNDRFDEWSHVYPTLNEIEALSSDLEWSNAHNIDKDWEKLLQLIAQLEREVVLANRSNGGDRQE